MPLNRTLEAERLPAGTSLPRPRPLAPFPGDGALLVTQGLPRQLVRRDRGLPGEPAGRAELVRRGERGDYWSHAFSDCRAHGALGGTAP